MDLQVLAAITFVVFLTVFLLVNRQKIVLQKIIHPILYMVMYRSQFGINFINKFAKKYKEQIKVFGYSCIGFGFVGMIFITINILFLLFTIISSPASPAGVSLVLPFTNIPGIGYLSFLHWIIAIFILALVHEFSHAIVARAHDLEIKSSGFAFLCLFVPVIPAAFVEPDEKKMHKHSDVAQYSIFAAGPMMNILLAVLILIAFPYVANSAKLAPFEDKITEPVGFSFDLMNETVPAARAGLESGMIITSFNGKEVKDAQEFAEDMYYCSSPGRSIALIANEKEYKIETEEIDGRAMIGITNIKNERRVLPEYDWIKHPYYWTKELFRWLFLLNLFIGLFNLLPLGIVDGGLMMGLLLRRTSKNEHRAKKIWTMISTTLLLILLLALLTTYFGNPFSLLFS